MSQAKKKKKKKLSQARRRKRTLHGRFRRNTKGKGSPNSLKSKEKASGPREHKTNGQRIFTEETRRNIKKLKELEEMSARAEKSSLSQDM